jgi:hypothetical protein
MVARNSCDVCVKVCPTDVFDRGPDGVPVSTPVESGSPHADENGVTERGLFGGYRELVGWSRAARQASCSTRTRRSKRRRRNPRCCDARDRDGYHRAVRDASADLAAAARPVSWSEIAATVGESDDSSRVRT